MSDKILIPGLPSDIGKIVAATRGAKANNDAQLTPKFNSSSATTKHGLTYSDNFELCKYYKDLNLIYLGTWEPANMKWNTKKEFDLFGMNGNRNSDRYDRHIEWLKQLKTEEGYRGADFYSEKDLRNAIENETYKGEFFIPSIDMMLPNSSNNRITMKHGSIYDIRHTGDFKKVASKTMFSLDYVSCTGSCQYAKGIHSVNFSTGDCEIGYTNKHIFTTIFVRAVERKPSI